MNGIDKPKEDENVQIVLISAINIQEANSRSTLSIERSEIFLKGSLMVKYFHPNVNSNLEDIQEIGINSFEKQILEEYLRFLPTLSYSNKHP